MEYKHNVVGPDFDKADLVTFHLDDVDIIMPVPEPPSEFGYREIAPNNVSQIADSKWNKDESGTYVTTLAYSNWESLNKLDGLMAFETRFEVLLRRLSPEQQAKSIPLNRLAFAHWALEFMHDWVRLNESEVPNSATFEDALMAWQVQQTVEDFEVIERDGVQWLLATIEHVAMGLLAQPFAFVPLNREYLLQIFVESERMSYTSGGGGSKIPREDADAMMIQFIHDYFKLVRIEYSDELRAEIQRQNSV